MFVPHIYYVAGHTWPRRIIRNHPLAILTTNGPDLPYATHLPAIFAPDVPEHGDMTGASLVGHLNRANPHWAALRDGMSARLIFSGPGGYVTPVLYRATPAAPTWNFVTVHVLGHLRLIENPEQTLDVVRATAFQLERDFGSGWDQRNSIGYFRRILPGVGAFRLRICAVQCMFKLSQEKSTETQAAVLDWFATSGAGAHAELADIMHELGLGSGATANEQ